MLTLFILEHVPAPHVRLPRDQKGPADQSHSLTKNLHVSHEPFLITFPSYVFNSFTILALFSSDKTKCCVVTAHYFKFITTTMNSSICHPTWLYEDSQLERLHNIARIYTNLGRGAHSEEGIQMCSLCSHPSLDCYGLKYLQHLLIKSQ